MKYIDWIRMQDQLPQPGNPIAFMYAPNADDSMRITIVGGCHQERNGLTFHDTDAPRLVIAQERVTHWCPLPTTDWYVKEPEPTTQSPTPKTTKPEPWFTELEVDVGALDTLAGPKGPRMGTGTIKLLALSDNLVEALKNWCEGVVIERCAELAALDTEKLSNHTDPDRVRIAALIGHAEMMVRACDAVIETRIL